MNRRNRSLTILAQHSRRVVLVPFGVVAVETLVDILVLAEFDLERSLVLWQFWATVVFICGIAPLSAMRKGDR